MNFKLRDVEILSYRALRSDDSNDSSCQNEDFNNHRAVGVGGRGSVPPSLSWKKKNLTKASLTSKEL